MLTRKRKSKEASDEGVKKARAATPVRKRGRPRKEEGRAKKRKTHESPLATNSKRSKSGKNDALKTENEKSLRNIDNEKVSKENDRSNLKRKVPKAPQNNEICETKQARLETNTIENQGDSKKIQQNSTVETKKYSLNFQMDKLKITKPFSQDLNIQTKIIQAHRPEAYWVPNEWMELL